MAALISACASLVLVAACIIINPIVSKCKARLKLRRALLAFSYFAAVNIICFACISINYSSPCESADKYLSVHSAGGMRFALQYVFNADVVETFRFVCALAAGLFGFAVCSANVAQPELKSGGRSRSDVRRPLRQGVFHRRFFACKASAPVSASGKFIS